MSEKKGVVNITFEKKWKRTLGIPEALRPTVEAAAQIEGVTVAAVLEACLLMGLKCYAENRRDKVRNPLWEPALPDRAMTEIMRGRLYQYVAADLVNEEILLDPEFAARLGGTGEARPDPLNGHARHPDDEVEEVFEMDDPIFEPV